jgi:lipoprotein-releasing system ATP-binding protein
MTKPDQISTPSELNRNAKSQTSGRLAVSNLYKSFQRVDGSKLEVLRGISFAVEPGEVVAIRGASGAGKSTLLHLLGGLEQVEGGTILLGRFDVTLATGEAMARYRNGRVGFVFQFHRLLPDLTASENVALPVMIGRVSRRRALERAVGLLERCGLGDKLEQPVARLSGGEQQRVAVARALIKQPTLVLADEPTGNLDPDIGSEISSMLLGFCRESNAAAVIATHNERLSGQCDRTFLLRNGELF